MTLNEMFPDKNNDKFIDISRYENPKYPFQVIIGGRGGGKTYSALKWAIYNFREYMQKFMWMRRTADELSLLCDSVRFGEGGNPFKEINDKHGMNYGLCMMNKKVGGIYDRILNEEKKIYEYPQDGLVGYATALSNISSARGMNFTDADRLFYDEFIPERHVKKIRNEGEAILNAIETIGRNREILGKPPLYVYFLANSFNIYNELFKELGVVSNIERALRRGQADIYFTERGLAIHILPDTAKYVKEKKQTALYKLTENSDFADMALSNEFVYNDFSLVEYRRIQGYRPCCRTDHFYIYQKKGSQEYYVTYTPCKADYYETGTEHGLRAWRIDWGRALLPVYTAGHIFFETYELKEIFLEFLSIH